MSVVNVKMERNTYLAFMMIISVQGEFISNFMLRNSSYDSRATYAIHVIFTSNFRSLLDCGSQCTALHECKSVMFNMDTHQCQLLSVYMDDLSNAGPHTSLGWLYYERKTGKYMYILCIFLIAKRGFFCFVFFYSILGSLVEMGNLASINKTASP